MVWLNGRSEDVLNENGISAALYSQRALALRVCLRETTSPYIYSLIVAGSKFAEQINWL